MQIILKYIIRSSVEKKVRTLLIILAIAISGGLFYAALSMKGTLEGTYVKSFIQTEGKADLKVITNKDSPTWYIPTYSAQKKKESCRYIINKLEYMVELKRGIDHYDPVQAVGMNIEDYKSVYDLTLLKQMNLEPFIGNKVIISESTAEYYNLNLGDEVKLKIGGRERKYQIVGIAALKGIFYSETLQRIFLVPYDKLSGYLDTNGYPTTMFVKTKEGVSVETLKDDLEKLYPKYQVEEPFTQADLDEKTSMISMALLFMSIMLSFMSIFIIHSSFKVIMIQKLPILGTFRSVGADRKKINKVMYMESSFYGLLGSILGCLLGVGLGYILAVVTMPTELKLLGEKVAFEVSITHLILSFVVANLICFISTYSPTNEVSSLPIKDIVLGLTKPKKNKNRGKAFIGVILLLIASILPQYMSTKPLVALVGICLTMPSISIGTGYLLPWTAEKIAVLFRPILSLLFGNVGIIAAQNMKKDETLLNSASLITIGLTVLLLINSLTINLTDKLIKDIADLQKYDVCIAFDKITDEHLAQIKAYKEVEDAVGYNRLFDVPVAGMATNVTEIDGVSRMAFFKFMDVGVTDNDEALISKLQDNRNVIITKTMQKRNSYQIGDKIEIDFTEFGGKKKEYVIIGAIDTVMQAGSYMMIAEKYLQMDIHSSYYSIINIHLKDQADLTLFKEKLKRDFKAYTPLVETGNVFRESMRDMMKEMTSLLTGFAVIAIFVGGLGIINNFMISFIERKRSLAIYRSIGMSKVQVLKMLMIEAGLIGIAGGLVGALGGMLSLNVSPLFMTLANVDMKMSHYIELYGVYILGATLVAIIASSSPAFSAFKMNIIEGVKYE